MERTVRIERPRARVYDYLADLQHVAEYIGPIQRFYRQSTPTLEVGTRVSVDVHFLGITFTQRAECYKHRRPSAFAARSVGGRFFFEAGFRLRTDAGQTVLEGWGRAQAPRLFGIAEPVLKFFVERQIDGDLKRLKRRLESGEVG
ncbi:MAG: SRPBCC family protein [Candidatus Dormibacteria bacterium]